MPAPSRCIAPALAIALGGVGSEGFNVSDLYMKNYDDTLVGMWCSGLTASGFEQGANALRSQYSKPSRDAIRHFHERGSNCFRVPITWERLQSSLGSTDLDPVSGFLGTIKYITENLGDYAIVVPYGGAGGGLRYEFENVGRVDFVNLWTAISKEFAQNDRVIFELYNFPQYGCIDGNCSDDSGDLFGFEDDSDGAYVKAWLEWCQGAVDAIRAQGADNYVIVPGLKESRCRDWTGAQFWGESLDGEDHRGNLRLFALSDPSMRTAYSVHQYFASTLDAWSTGCGGHDEYEYDPTGWAADEALNHTIAMAQKYNKKLWMTELGSFPDLDASTEVLEGCERKLRNYLSTMADSGVFLGYQVWQFGCQWCGQGTQDQLTMDPVNNLDWYDLEKYGITVTTATSTTTPATTTGTTDTTYTLTWRWRPTTTTTSSTTVEASGALPALPGAGLLASAALAQAVAC